MDERLTPHLRRRVLALPVSDRLALNAEIVRSLNDVPTIERLDVLRDKMEGCAGVDVRVRTRLRKYVEARMVFSYVAKMEGYTQNELAEFLGCDHSTVCTTQKSMARAFETPRAYASAINLYNEYVTAIL